MRLRFWLLLSALRCWWAMMPNRLVAWRCNATGGHRWGTIETWRAPRTGDHVTWIAGSVCGRCHQMMSCTYNVTGDPSPDIEAYALHKLGLMVYGKMAALARPPRIAATRRRSA